MIPNAAPAGETFPEEIRKWISSSLQIIDQNIKIFEERQTWNELSKWAWFRNEFSKVPPCRSDTPDYHVENRTIRRSGASDAVAK
jgi:hypothetical protein